MSIAVNIIQVKTMSARFDSTVEQFTNLMDCRFQGYELVRDEYGVSLIKDKDDRPNMSYLAWTEGVRGAEFSCKKNGGIEKDFWDLPSAIAYMTED